MKYFTKCTTLEDLKAEYRRLAMLHHPDRGGDTEIMKEINIEYYSAFPGFKAVYNATAKNPTNETAESTCNEFYTANGWKGSNYTRILTLKEIAQIVRSYVKSKFPTYKFSIRTEYASMCQELHVDLKESPVEIYKTFEELTADNKSDLITKMMRNHIFSLTSWYDYELKAEFERIWEKHGNFYKCLNDVTKSVINDVDNFVNSYNYSDCDGMIDYFDVNFYYFGCLQNNGMNVKIVPKKARIKKAESTPAKKAAEKETAEQPQLKTGYTYNITQGEDTRDNSPLWIVRIKETLDKAAYIAENKAMKERGGYYSKFKHGFIFRFDPTEILTA